MLLEQVVIEAKVVNMKASSYPRNTLVSRAAADMKGDVSDFMRRTLRNQIIVVVRGGKKLWTLDARPINNVMYKMVTSPDVV